MFNNLLRKVFGSANDRLIKKYFKTVEKINALEPQLKDLSDAELKARTPWLKERLEKGETVDDILVDAFATVREASKRALGMRPFDVQLVGALVLHHGMISEMKTGEGKTLVATLPVYLNALTGRGVHVVTVNDYLAKRDSDWMGRLYSYLGLKVGCIVHGLSDSQRREAYHADVTYGTNHEFGFDYLRDNMKFRLGEMVQREFHYAIVDEVDSILIDEARTPLIISGSAEDSSELYARVNKIIPMLEELDFEKDEKQRNVLLTDSGVTRIEDLLRQDGLLKSKSLYDLHNIALVHHVNSALKAHKIFVRDVDYIVKDGKVVIIDEFTGRMMDGRRYSEGLHQALEAKEGVDIEMENQTLASITYQNFFRQYEKLSGMTGTAMTEASEFEEIYKLRVVEVPTNVDVIRKDYDDQVFLTAMEKFQAVIELIRECQARRQPVLVGTTSIEKSELVSMFLKTAGISHQVLNARHHDKEATIILEAGRPGAVTIATNMAGRGTDIKLGGNLEVRIAQETANMTDESKKQEIIKRLTEEYERDYKIVKEAGGLYVLATERHESRRIDNQLRGRSGRQGDPGASKFFISLQDDLMRIFGSERMEGMLRRLGVKDGEVISHTWINKSIERAQQKVEARNFDIRKHLLRYDDVMSDQRKIVYDQRKELMKADEIDDMVEEIRRESLDEVIAITTATSADSQVPEDWNIEGLRAALIQTFNFDLPIEEWIKEEGMTIHILGERLKEIVSAMAKAKEDKYSKELLRHAEKALLLRVLDQTWKEHLLNLDHLRQGINLRAYAQSNPLNEYKREAFNLFHDMLGDVRRQFIGVMSRFDLDIPTSEDVEEVLDPHTNFSSLAEETPDWMSPEQDLKKETTSKPSQKTTSRSKKTTSAEKAKSPTKKAATPAAKLKTDVDSKDPSTWGRVLRNSLCPCGSGKRYKHCHGAVSEDTKE